MWQVPLGDLLGDEPIDATGAVRECRLPDFLGKEVAALEQQTGGKSRPARVELALAPSPRAPARALPARPARTGGEGGVDGSGEGVG